MYNITNSETPGVNASSAEILQSITNQLNQLDSTRRNKILDQLKQQESDSSNKTSGSELHLDGVSVGTPQSSSHGISHECVFIFALLGY